ncbi:LysR substrate-binding domain-containing protein [Agrobacterium rubi]|uniref:HTH-type transcriptional regulator TtuA n=1 Tax=Agrobacterium rubi TaxID=28099 RepID=A0AAE7USR8_9HYPH|nr:LysR substrate-binding domain-containing protein [Agrobacterium rubi]NTE88240.1 LysR family transcriptional regulator [Agrobacterium rubi]NTF04006.1 LysR family transcriptional regulator [Agrobacterium rubi]NTF38337.1 LysR family transcriptional regulator [Agrobacterium rubi]OCJ47299.1 transcriptional regulator [Agrobacterium rubi]QTG02155.1 LysR family transcriptional regulator [Agrobacterium rubi]
MRRYLPSLSALHAFEAAARYMSFTKAADDLGLTQSGISRQIKNLEDFLGVTLFHRSGPRLVLTEIGANYYRDLALTLDKLQEISIDAVRGRAIDSSLMIGAHPTFATRWLPQRLSSFMKANPDVPLEVTPAMPTTDFETTRLDIAVLRGAGTWLHARAIELFPETLAVVASPSLIPLGQKLEPLDFCHFPMLQNSTRPSLWLNWLRLAGLSYNGRIHGTRFSHHEMIINAAIHGMGIAVLPTFYIEQELSSGQLHMPFGDPIRSDDSYFAVYPERKSHNPNIILFRDWLIRESRKSSAEDTTSRSRVIEDSGH